jgi:hypothetical protein
MFDKSKPFGTLCGETADGARYRQDGVRYLSDGTPVAQETVESEEETVEQVAETDINKMTKDQLEVYTLEEFGLDIDKRKKIGDLRAEVTALIEAVE